MKKNYLEFKTAYIFDIDDDKHKLLPCIIEILENGEKVSQKRIKEVLDRCVQITGFTQEIDVDFAFEIVLGVNWIDVDDIIFEKAIKEFNRIFNKSYIDKTILELGR